MTEPQDPTGFRIEVDGDEYVLIFLPTQAEVGRYPTREKAIAAAKSSKTPNP